MAVGTAAGAVIGFLALNDSDGLIAELASPNLHAL
jgi:hypothetical protein